MSIKITTEIFIERAQKIHGYKYNYSKSIYKNALTEIEIICPIHGIFRQIPRYHYNGKGCILCGIATQTNKRTKSIEKFIIDSKNIHGNKYDYSNVNYVNAHTKIEIICPIHGSFQQTPNSHINGRNCPTCKSSKGELKIKRILDSKNISYIQEKKFKNCKSKRPLPFDFYLPDHNICLEYDGIQHFEWSISSNFGKFKLSKQQYLKNHQRDKIKNNYCYENGIKLIRIPYWEKDNINKIFLSLSVTI